MAAYVTTFARRFAGLAMIMLSSALPIAWASPPGGSGVKAGSQRVPDWTKLQAALEHHFAETSQYQPGDIISRSQVESLLVEFRRMGWAVKDPQSLLKQVPEDTSWLVRHLRTPKGRTFMRKIAKYPQGYDRVDQLSRLSDGRRIVSDLIRGPGGDELIEYLTTTKWGNNTSKQLSIVPGGANFDKPTGAIYTAEALSEALFARYQADRSAGSARR